MTTDVTMFIVHIFIVQALMFAASAPVNTAILAAVPPTIAATAFAVSIFAIHALGDLISPPVVGYLADTMPLERAMLILPVILVMSGIVWAYFSIRSHVRKPLSRSATLTI